MIAIAVIGGVASIYVTRKKSAILANNTPSISDKKVDNPLSLANAQPQIVQPARKSITSFDEQELYDNEQTGNENKYVMVSNDYIKTLQRQASMSRDGETPMRVNFKPLMNRKQTYDPIKLAASLGEPPALEVPPPPVSNPFILRQTSLSNINVKPISLPKNIESLKKTGSIRQVNPFQKPEQQPETPKLNKIISSSRLDNEIGERF